MGIKLCRICIRGRLSRLGRRARVGEEKGKRIRRRRTNEMRPGNERVPCVWRNNRAGASRVRNEPEPDVGLVSLAWCFGGRGWQGSLIVWRNRPWKSGKGSLSVDWR